MTLDQVNITVCGT